MSMFLIAGGITVACALGAAWLVMARRNAFDDREEHAGPILLPEFRCGVKKNYYKRSAHH